EIGADTNVSATAAVAKNGERVLITWKACFFIGCVSSSSIGGSYFGGGRHNRLSYSVYETVFKDESIVVVALGEPGVPLICWALTITAASRKYREVVINLSRPRSLGVHSEHSCGSQFPWSVLRPKNLG